MRRPADVDVDLVDLQSLLREFRDSAGFWRQLLSRAEELGIGRPLYFALDAVSRILEFPVPMEVMAELEPHAPVTMPLLRPMFAHCLRPYHVRAEGPVVAAARFAVYIRSHYLRMPFSMLIPHLTRKAVRRWKEGEEAAA